eukprot:6286765-Prymnesium_polylepis.1
MPPSRQEGGAGDDEDISAFLLESRSGGRGLHGLPRHNSSPDITEVRTPWVDPATAPQACRPRPLTWQEAKP